MKKSIIAILSSLFCIASIAQNTNQYGVSSVFANYGNLTGGHAAFTALNNRENTQGTRFLFNTWLKGKVTDAKGLLIDNDSLGFNFDKQSDNLVIKKDEASFISVPPSQVKDFTLLEGGKSYHFTKVAAIDSSKILLALAESKDKYSLYKAVKTKFEQANYFTNGVVTSGHEFDEYIDQTTYYLLQPGGNAYKVVDLKAKSVKSAFPSDKIKVNDYMIQHNADMIDEPYLIGLVTQLNQL